MDNENSLSFMDLISIEFDTRYISPVLRKFNAIYNCYILMVDGSVEGFLVFQLATTEWCNTKWIICLSQKDTK